MSALGALRNVLGINGDEIHAPTIDAAEPGTLTQPRTLGRLEVPRMLLCGCSAAALLPSLLSVSSSVPRVGSMSMLALAAGVQSRRKKDGVAGPLKASVQLS